MRRVRKLLFSCLFVLLSVTLFSCKNALENNPANNHRIIDIKNPLKEVGFWKSTEIEGDANTVTLELSRDVDLLFWTKENGEALEIDRKGLNAQQNLHYAVSDKPCVFTFKEPGVYILNIYQKPNSKEKFNLEDVDFRGKVLVGPKAVKLQDTGYAEKCRKHALYTIFNNSNAYSDGNVITELVFAAGLGREWDYKRRRNYAVYKAEHKYSNLYLKPGDVITMLLPIGENINNTRYGYAILKPVVKNSETYYYIQTTNLWLNNNKVSELSKRTSKQGTMGNQHNGVLTYVNNNRFEMPW